MLLDCLAIPGIRFEDERDFDNGSPSGSGLNCTLVAASCQAAQNNTKSSYRLETSEDVALLLRQQQQQKSFYLARELMSLGAGLLCLSVTVQQAPEHHQLSSNNERQSQSCEDFLAAACGFFRFCFCFCCDEQLNKETGLMGPPHRIHHYQIFRLVLERVSASMQS